MQEKLFKSGMTGLNILISFYMGNISTLVWLLIIFEIVDYFTGILAAFKAHNLSSERAFWGFIRKLSYFVLVSVGFGVDYVIMEATNLIGLEFNYPAVFGVLSVCYLLSTESISILENISEFGVNVPFLSKFLHTMRDKISDKGGDTNDNK